MTKGLTVLVAGDHPPALRGLRCALEHHGFTVVAEAGDAEEAVAAAVRHRPSVGLLEFRLPDDGTRAAAGICRELPDTKIAMLADSTDEDAFFSAISAGADGYLLKSTAPDRLSAALRALVKGEVALPRALTRRLVDEVRFLQQVDTDNRHDRKPSLLLYAPRFVRHFHRRMRSGVPARLAWESARKRMHTYSG